MRPRRYPRNNAFAPTDLAPALRLWLLRLLVPLNAQRNVVNAHGFADDGLASLIGLGHWIEPDSEDFDPKAVRAELRALHQDAERDAADIRLPEQLAKNVARLAALVSLSDADCRILEFAVMLHSERVLDDTADYLGQLSSLKVYQVLSVVLSLPETSIRNSLEGQGVLPQSGLLALDRDGTATLRSKLNLLSGHFADRITASNADPIGLLRDCVIPASRGHLGMTDFEHLSASLELLIPYLRRAIAEHRQGVNVLLHGSPGTGKNQFVKVVAAELGCELYEVSSEDSDGNPVGGNDRLRAYRAAQSVLSQTRSLILFDEVQDVFESGNAHTKYGHVTTHGKKAWINRMLEGNPAPSLWLTNSIANVDPAFIRRFDMVLEIPVPPRRQREKIVRKACGGLIDERAVFRLADCEALAPAVVARAASVVSFVAGELELVSPESAMQRLIHNTLQAQGHAGLSQASVQGLPETYDPALTQADADLDALVRGLSTARSGRLCLYGPPGTGKTAWVRWLARALEKPLISYRASDLMSKWVGDNERNIAAAFRRAEADGAILLIDEVDSFLQDRRGAQQSWEVTIVNEMLTQMESFGGLFLASTNLINDLDAAALRRFDLKVKFDYLNSEKAWTLLEREVSELGLSPPGHELRARLSRLDQLTPGDYAAVTRQHRFRRIGTSVEFVSALESEVAAKRQGRVLPIGFV